MWLSIAATAALAADCVLTLTIHSGVDNEINPVLRWIWERLSETGVAIYFMAFIAGCWLIPLQIGNTRARSLYCVIAIIASSYGVVSILLAHKRRKRSKP